MLDQTITRSGAHLVWPVSDHTHEVNIGRVHAQEGSNEDLVAVLYTDDDYNEIYDNSRMRLCPYVYTHAWRCLYMSN